MAWIFSGCLSIRLSKYFPLFHIRIADRVPGTISIVFGALFFCSVASLRYNKPSPYCCGKLPFACCNVKNRSYLPNLAQPCCSNPIFIDNFAPHEQEEKIDISVHSGV